MKKITVIIPNYNNGKFIDECLSSVVCQNYPEIQMIVVDDGSTDDSVKKIKNFIKQHKNADIRLIQQNNLNAAMARNEGMKIADGDYVLFLDSDDLLKDNALKAMVEMYEKEKTDLVIGGYEEIDERGKVYGAKCFTNEDIIFDVKKDFVKLMDIKPAPPNKLYRLDLIRQNGLVWGNVRIGQDLDFYLKYLALCKKVSVTKLNIYKYRATSNSMTRSFDFRIFDIVNVFEDVRKFYETNGRELTYERYVPLCALRHYESEMTKQMYYKDREVRRLIMNYFSICEKRLDYSKCEINDEYKRIHLKFKIKQALRLILISNMYCKYKARKRK